MDQFSLDIFVNCNACIWFVL